MRCFGGIYPINKLELDNQVDDVKKYLEIIVRLNSLEELLVNPSNTQYRRRFLDQDVEEYIIEQAKGAPAVKKVILKIQLLSGDPVDDEIVTMAIKKNFGNRRQESQLSLKQTLRHGRRSLVVAFIFFAIILSIIEISKRVFPDNSLTKTLGESLTILGWVALWRPAELLLYEWRPFKQEQKLFSRLEQCEIQIQVGT
jgi:hypothetical protein